MNNCQHCQTELENARAKNCKACTAILSEANRYGTYGFMMEAIAIGKANGTTGTEMHSTMQEAMKVGTSKRNEWMNELRKRQNERKQEASEEIKFHQDHGYWQNSSQRDEETPRIEAAPARGSEYSDQTGIDG